MYDKLLQALYGIFRLVLFFYKKSRKDLEDMGFEVNPYDHCVANKMINESQINMTWHVDDLKVLHKESTEVTKFIFTLAKHYGNGLSVTRGKIHSYLGMDFNYAISGAVQLSMILCSKQIKDDFPEPITSTAPTPAADHLFQVRSNCP